MTQKEMLDEINAANVEIQKVLDWVKEHEAAFDMMDLKMHNVSYYIYSGMEDDFPLTYAEEKENKSNYDQFYWWCEDMWRSFEEWLEEEGIKWSQICNRVGRTSSFYLHDQNIIEFNRRTGRPDYTNILENFLCNEWNCYTLPIKNGFIDTEMSLEDYEEYFATDVGYVQDDFYKEFTDKFEDTVKVYEYIKDCKDNQVKYFKEYVANREAELEYEVEQERKYEEERQELLGKFTNEIVREIYDRNRLSNKDLQVLVTV